MNRHFKIRFFVLLLAILIGILSGCNSTNNSDEPNFLDFSRIPEAQILSDGQGTVVAVADWMFDMKGKEARKYIHPTSLIDDEDIGELKPWHGEWMAQIVHAVAPEAKIIPIKCRGLNDQDYERHLLTAIRLAADRGAVAICSSMGPMADSPELHDAIAYAEEKGTIFVDVHPEYVFNDEGKMESCSHGQCNPLIIHTGPVSVPDHPEKPHANRDIHTWPYSIEDGWEDGWGFSNCPPIVAGTIALMKSANPRLTNDEVRKIIVETGYQSEDFLVLDARAAVEAAQKK